MGIVIVELIFANWFSQPQNAASAEVVGEMGTAENSAEYQEQQAVEEDVKME